ncbi:MAG: TetR/AcrR family transcriptional regulator [Candidatus Caldatribacterium sp.]|uniref:TetR/AcrR family transcriptional regulator n=1 Tax=Candidatus Caldatribacterium sp. TaxID=2282143 RepID=UPI0037EF858F|nr:TetR/AcrR family transcriptional regulator [Candidatus Caldatribacterium sp.]MCX7729689.1 TetR/AcrR family transcriptional regulator [Candidatus Caldatribacterium sp.]
MEETRRKILEAAKKVFAEKSFFDATLEDVAHLSGVKKSTVYYYFESKLDLLMKIVHEALEELATALEANLSRGNAREILVKLVDCYCDFFSQKSDLFVVFQRAAFDLLSHEESCKYFEEIIQKLRDLRRRVAEKIGEITTKAGKKVSGDTLLRVVTSSIGGYCIEELREGRTIAEEDREFLKEVFTAFLA